MAERAFTPSDLAKRYGVGVGKILTLIRTGELAAINLASATIDLAVFRAPVEGGLSVVRQCPQKGPPRHRQGEAFLKGPIPWAWLHRAMLSPGKALHVAMLLWRESGMKRNRTVRFNLSAATGLTSGSARRGLRALETANLVTVDRRPGQALIVTLLEAPVENGDI